MVAPSRELAMQIVRVAQSLLPDDARATVQQAIGGANPARQVCLPPPPFRLYVLSLLATPIPFLHHHQHYLHCFCFLSRSPQFRLNEFQHCHLASKQWHHALRVCNQSFYSESTCEAQTTFVCDVSYEVSSSLQPAVSHCFGYSGGTMLPCCMMTREDWN